MKPISPKTIIPSTLPRIAIIVTYDVGEADEVGISVEVGIIKLFTSVKFA
jgi:hypothetical protein